MPTKSRFASPSNWPAITWLLENAPVPAQGNVDGRKGPLPALSLRNNSTPADPAPEDPVTAKSVPLMLSKLPKATENGWFTAKGTGGPDRPVPVDMPTGGEGG